MKWQVKYFIENTNKRDDISLLNPDRKIIAKYVTDDFVEIGHKDEQYLVAVNGDNEITFGVVKNYHENEPELAFVCGYRKECKWTNEALKYLEDNSIGWGNSGTLYSAVYDDQVHIASHKDYSFAVRLLNQTKSLIHTVDRKYHCVFDIENKDGNKYRVVLALEYEPTADAVRTLWERYGSFDLFWNINPNGNPTTEAVKAGEELGCKVVKWEEMKSILAKSY